MVSYVFHQWGYMVLSIKLPQRSQIVIISLILGTSINWPWTQFHNAEITITEILYRFQLWDTPQDLLERQRAEKLYNIAQHL